MNESAKIEERIGTYASIEENESVQKITNSDVNVRRNVNVFLHFVTKNESANSRKNERIKEKTLDSTDSTPQIQFSI